MIRVYFCKWRVEETGGKKRVTNDIIEEADAQNPTGLDWISSHYSPSKNDGTPKKNFCLVLVKAKDFSFLDLVSGLTQLPVGDLSQTLPSAEKAQIIAELDSKFKISPGLLVSAQRRKDLINKTMKHIHPDYVTYSSSGHIKDEEFE